MMAIALTTEDESRLSRAGLMIVAFSNLVLLPY
jgi:hypothetical protein